MTPVCGDAIIDAARECLETPFLHQGRLPHKGLDCAGLLVHCFQSVRVPYDDSRGYPRHPYRGLIKSILDHQPSLMTVRDSALFPGAVLLMAIHREPQHVAIYTGSTIIHSYSGIGRVVEHHLDPRWEKRIKRVYQIVRR